MLVKVTKVSKNYNKNGIKHGDSYKGSLFQYDLESVKKIDSLKDLKRNKGLYIEGIQWLKTTALTNITPTYNDKDGGKTINKDVCFVDTQNSTYMIEVVQSLL